MPTIPTPPQSGGPDGADPSRPGAEQLPGSDASDPSRPGEEGSDTASTGDPRQGGAVPRPGQPDGGTMVGDRDGDRSGGDPSAGDGGRPDSGTSGTPADTARGGLPQPGDDGWESSNEDPGDGRPAGGEQEQGTGGEDERHAAGGRPGAQGEFEEAIGVLDGQILAERADVVARRNETAGQGGPTALPSGDEGGSESDAERSRGMPGDPSPGVMPEGDGRRMPRPAPRGVPAPAAPVPADIADARDDDVVCRQLREAAMAETDDALREALWDEYRRCREG